MSLDHQFDEPTAIQTNLGAIFISLESSRSTWLITSLSPGGGEKMSKHSVSAGNIAALLTRLWGRRRRSGAAASRRWVSASAFGPDFVLETEGVTSGKNSSKAAPFQFPPSSSRLAITCA